MADKTVVKLEELQAKYPAALYSYFRVSNITATFARFNKNHSQIPHFTYRHGLEIKDISAKIKAVEEDLRNVRKSSRAALFLEWRRAEYKVLQQFFRLRRRRYIGNDDIQAYIAAQTVLYGPLDEELFADVFAFLLKKAAEKNKLKNVRSLKRAIQVAPSSHTLPVPTKATFLHYHKLFRQVLPELQSALEAIPEKKAYTSLEIKQYFTTALDAIGARAEGWRVVRVHAGGNLVVSKYKKKILLPRNFTPKNVLRLRQVIAHEVGGHVRRSLIAQRAYQGYDDQEEGVAILLEQLVDDHFVHKRAMRYFAIGLACGLDGQPRDFKEVYLILLNAYDILGYNTDQAKRAAYSETVRVFRGGLPAVKGVAYIKDKIYLEGNLKVWQKLQDQRCAAAEFEQLLSGHGTMQT